MTAQIKRGLLGVTFTMLLLWDFWYAWGWRTCSAAQPPGMPVYWAVWGPEITFFVTVPLIVTAFVIGYFFKATLSSSQLTFSVLILLALAAAFGIAIGRPSAECSPL